MEKFPRFVPVVAAAIRDRSGRLLLQQQLAGKRHAGLWEFPGGKIESGETPRQALGREIAEELGIFLDTAALVPAGFAEEPTGSARAELVLFLYTCDQWRGDPDGLEGQAWNWFTPEEATALPMPPMDRTLLLRLCRNRGG